MYTWKEILFYQENHPLLFTQYLFWIFFFVLMLGYGIVYKKPQLRLIYLFVFSLFFYYKSGGYFFFLLIFSTVVDFNLGNAIYRARKKFWRGFFLSCSVVINLGILSYFKYAYFYLDLINNAFGTNFQAHNYLAELANTIGGSHFDVSTIILPVGISFFTFQTLSYSIDLYRQKIEPAKNIFDFAFFVTFFPQLVAGPIVRAAEFLPQMYKPYELSREDFNRATYLIMNGLMKKILISDYISANFVDRVFDNPKLYSGFENLMAVYGYTIQIYCDFSGYTDIAIGLALLLGFRLPINFNSPYKAISVTDFWRRWHISLSSWLRDYLYIPLGGNRKGKFRMYFNLFITMFLGGLWHGAHLRFLIWGGLHGIAQAFYKAWSSIFPKKEKRSLFARFIGWLLTFHFVAFCWIFFRAGNMELVNQMLYQIAYQFKPELIQTVSYAYRYIFAVMAFAYVIHWLPVRWKDGVRALFMQLPLVAKAFAIVVIVVVLYQVTSAGVQPFIYFQF
jgi:D-alanyl-lipoteichoic acid acyltransferase DltB (MBOAT superfamily)